MDYVFWASIVGEKLAEIFVTYDIGCQWRINLLGKRFADVPDELRPHKDETPSVNVALPVFHSACHDEECGSAETCRHKRGVGMTDGEGVERIWAGFNELASATKEMHQDVRHDALEDAIDHHNWSKNLALGAYTPLLYFIRKSHHSAGLHARQKREVALVEQKRQEESFKLTGESVSAADKREWVAKIDAWHEQEYMNPKDRTAENPYTLARQKDGTQHFVAFFLVTHLSAEKLTEGKVAETLLAAEKAELADGDTSGSGVANFVRMGLQLQKIQ